MLAQDARKPPSTWESRRGAAAARRTALLSRRTLTNGYVAQSPRSRDAM
jgi:hypothetical protein